MANSIVLNMVQKRCFDIYDRSDVDRGTEKENKISRKNDCFASELRYNGNNIKGELKDEKLDDSSYRHSRQREELVFSE